MELHGHARRQEEGQDGDLVNRKGRMHRSIGIVLYCSRLMDLEGWPLTDCSVREGGTLSHWLTEVIQL